MDLGPESDNVVKAAIERAQAQCSAHGIEWTDDVRAAFLNVLGGEVMLATATEMTTRECIGAGHPRRQPITSSTYAWCTDCGALGHYGYRYYDDEKNPIPGGEKVWWWTLPKLTMVVGE